MKDKYTALWVSHSSMNDFLKCPRAYWLKNVYRNERGQRINTVGPALSLGSAVHETLEGLLNYKAEERAKQPLLEQFEENWKKYSGKAGGFKTPEEEAENKARGLNMILRVSKNMGPLLEKAVKLPPHKNNMPNHFFISEEENIILNGKVDWLQHIPEDDSLHVIDFKTGKNDEDQDSLQLPIYVLICDAEQKRKVSGVYYWYIERDDAPRLMPMPDTDLARHKIIEIAKQIKAAKLVGDKAFVCPRQGKKCFACGPFEKILRGEAELVKVDETRKTALYLV